MKKGKILFFSLLLLCLLAFPCSAWQQSFESHPSDEPLELFSNGRLYIPSGCINYSYLAYADENDPQYRTYLQVNKPYSGYLGMSIKVHQGYVPIFKVWNSSNDVIFSSSFQNIATSSATVNKFIRFEFIEESDGIEAFINGASAGYHPYTGTKNSGGHFAAGFMQYNNTDGEYEMNMVCDDVSDEETMIGCDEIANTTDGGQYYRCAFPPVTGSYWYSKVTNPSGAPVFQQYETDFGVTPYSNRTIPIANISTPGVYRISLYRHVNSSGADLFYTARSFEVVEPGSNENEDLGYYLYVAPASVSAGEQLHITTHIPIYEEGYKLKLSYTTSSNVISSEFIDITEQDHTSLWTVPATAAGGINYVYLLDPSGNVKATYQYTILGGRNNPTLVFSKSQYLPTEDIYLKYSNIPDGAELYIFELVGDAYTTPQENSISGNGNLNYKLKNKEAKEIYATVNKNGNLASANADIANGFYILKGQIFDANTKAPISNAEVDLDNDTSTTQYTDSTGAYNFTASVGSHVVFIYKAGYASAWNNVILSTDINTQNFYLNPEYVAIGGAGSLYGITTDSVTGKTLGSTYIQIKNGSTVYSALSRSDTGSYTFDSNDLIGTWTLTATKTGYDVYTTSVNLNGNIYHQIKLHPISSGGSDSSDSSGGSDSSDSRSTEDRPDLESAKTSLDWLESVMPGLIKLVVLIFLLALVGVKF